MQAHGSCSQLQKNLVNPFLLYKLIMGSLLHNSSAINHQNLIGISHSTQTVRNRDQGFVPGQLAIQPFTLVLNFY